MTTKTWNGGAGNWTTAANWSGGTVPSATDDALIEAAGNYTVAITTSISVGSVIVNNFGINGDNGATLDVESASGTVNIAGDLTISGEFGVDENTGEHGSSVVVGGTIHVAAGFFDIGPDFGISNVAGNTTLTAAELDNAATVQINSNPGGPQSTFNLTGDVHNAGAISLDRFGSGGGSNLTIGGTLFNTGSIAIGPGNNDLRANTTLSAAGLANTGTIILAGGANNPGTSQAVLNITSVAPTTLTGDVELYDNSLLEFASGQISSITGRLLIYGAGSGSALQPYVADAGNTGSNSALTGLTSNTGILWLRGGASITTSGAFSNSGDLELDRDGGWGGSSVTFGGTLTNTGYLQIGPGNDDLRFNTTVTATGLNNTGTINLDGGVGNPGTAQAVLNITTAAPTTLTGTVQLFDNSLLEFASGQISTIAGKLVIYGGGSGSPYQPFVAVAGNTGSNSALTGLTSNTGTLWLRGGTSVTTSAAFSNSGDLELDRDGGWGGSSLTIGGTLTNTGFLRIGPGNDDLRFNTTVTASGLNNSGTIFLDGGVGNPGTAQAVLNITAAAPTTLTGTVQLFDNSLLEFASGQIRTNAGTLLIYGGGAGTPYQSYVADAGNTGSNSALTGLTSNTGTLWLRGGTSITTSAALSNSGDLELDKDGGSGGSSLIIGGTLTNTGFLRIGPGNDDLRANTTVTASGLNNSGTIFLNGGVGNPGTAQAVLNITSAAPTTLTGTVEVFDNSLLEFASGQIKTIAGTLVLYGGGSGTPYQPFIADAGNTTSNSALTGLTSNTGTLYLRSGTSITTTAGFSNTGDLELDRDGGFGGSSLTLGGAFTNNGYLQIGPGNGDLRFNSTVSATTLNNTGTINLDGGAGNPGTSLALLTLSGNATTSGNITLSHNSEVAVTGAHSFTETGGTVTVGGLLVAPTININGGLLNFTSALTSGNGTGALNLGASGTLEFGAAVDNSHTVTFTGSTGTLELGAPGTFLGTIAGFSGLDVIDLLNSSVTGLSYSGTASAGTLTVSGSSGTIAALAFSGNFTTASFASVSDGHGGTDILLTQPHAVVQWSNTAGGAWTTGTNWVGGAAPGSSANAVIAAAGSYIVSLTSAVTVNAIDITDLNAVLAIAAAGGTETVTTNLTNAGRVNVDNGGGAGGTTVSIGGQLTNTGILTIGNGNLSQTTHVNAASLANTGSIALAGNFFAAGNQAVLSISGPAGFGSAGVVTGNVQLNGYALLQFGSGSLTTIAPNATLNLETGQSPVGGFIASGANTTSNSALTGLTSNAGNFDLSYGATVTTTSGTNFVNTGTVNLDNYASSPGGSSFTVGGTLTNDGTMNIGSGGISIATTVTANGLINDGTITVQGNNGGSTIGKLSITAPAGFGAAGIVTGTVNVYGDGLVQFSSGGLTTITAGSTLNVQTGIGYVASGANTTSNSALTGLTSNAGNFDLSYGATVTTTSGTNFVNTGSVNLDNYASSPGGSSFTIGGTLTNTGTMFIGGGGISAASTVTANALINSGTLDVQGNNGGSTIGKLNIAAPAGLGMAGVVTGTVNVFGDGLLQFASGGLTTIAVGSTLNIQTGIGYVASGANTTSNSALTGLTSNAGTFDLAYGAMVTTTSGTNFVNTGSTNIDDYASSPGGSSFTIGGTLINTGAMFIGSGGISAATTVTANGLTNSGTINVQGNNGGGTIARLSIAATAGFGAAGVVTGTVNVFGDGLVQFNSGGLTTIAAGSTLNIQTGIGYVASGGTTTSNSALTGLTSNAGNFNLSYGATVTATAGTNFINTGSVNIDDYASSPGGSTLSIGGTLTNTGTMFIGSGGIGALATLAAGGLVNLGTINLTGGSANARLILAGDAVNYGTMNTNASTAITVTGGHAFTEAAGTLNLLGSLTAASVNVTGGTLQGPGTINAAVSVTGGTLTAESNNNPATLTINGSYAQSGTGTLRELLRGTGSGQAGLLAVSGPLNLQGGTLALDVSGFSLAAGQSFTVATFQPGTLPGLFGHIRDGAFVGTSTYVDIGGGLTLEAYYNITAGNITVQVASTPATTADGWLGGAGNWSAAAKWSNGVPAPNSDVTIGTTGTGTVTLNIDDTINSLAITNGNALNFAVGKALAVGNALTVQAGGSLTLTTGDNMEVGGTASDAGSMTVGAGATFDALSGALGVSGALTVAGTVNGTGGTAVQMASGVDRLILQPGFSFGGNVVGGGAQSTLELAAGTGSGLLNALGTEFTKFGTVVVDGGATWTVDALASALPGVTLTGNGAGSTLTLISSGAANLGGVSQFPVINLAAGGNNVTVTNTTLSGGSVTINAGASGNNTVNASSDTAASNGKSLIYVAGSGTDKFTGGHENDTVDVAAAKIGGDTLTGGSGTNTLVLTTPGAANLGGTSHFQTINLAAGGNDVTVTDTTLSGGAVTINAGPSGNNTIDASGDTAASAGVSLTYVAGLGADAFTGGHENDTVQVKAVKVGGDTLTGGSGTNTLLLTTPGAANLGGVSHFQTIDLATAGNAVTVTDTTLSGGSVTTVAAGAGSNSVDASGDTAASAGALLTFVGANGTDTFTGGHENDTVQVKSAKVGGDTLTGGSGTNTLVLTTAGAANLGGVSHFQTINLAPGGNAVTITDTTLAGTPITTINAGASGNNTIDASGDTTASAGAVLTYIGTVGTDTFIGGHENDVVQVKATKVGVDTLTGGSGNNTLILTTAGVANLGGVSHFQTVDLFIAGNAVTVTDATLSGGAVTIVGAGVANNTVTASGDTAASAGASLTFIGANGTDVFSGGHENDTVQVKAAKVGGDTLSGGSGNNTLVLTTPGAGSLAGVSHFQTIDLSTAGNAVAVTDTTLSGGTVTIVAAGSGSNSVDASGDTAASAGTTLTFIGANGTDVFTGAHENDIVKIKAAKIGGDTLNGGTGNNTLVLTTGGAANLGLTCHFQTIDLAAGGNAVTLTDITLSGGTVTIIAAATGSNTVDASSDTAASAGASLTYVAGIGADTFKGGHENDTVQVAAAKVGGDTLTGGTGNNTLILTTSGNANLANVSGFGTIDLSNTGSNVVSLSPGNFIGLSGALTVNGGSAGNVIDTSALSSSNAVTLKGGAGNDTFKFSATGLAAADTVTGGGGSDTLVFTSAGTIVGTGVSGVGTWTLSSAGANVLTLTNANFTGVAGSTITVNGGSAGNTIVATGVSAANTLVLNGSAGSDTFRFSAASLTNTDAVTGAGGNDTLVITTGGTVNAAGVSGIEVYRLAASAADTLTLVASNFTGVAGKTIKVFGGSAGDTVDASGVAAGNNVVFNGGGGVDVYKGGGGNDTYNFAASDLTSADTLSGGGGADKLVLSTAGAIDVGGVSGIEAYHLASSGANTLVLSNANFTGVTGSLIQVFAGSAGDTLDASAVTTASDRAQLRGGAGNDILVAGTNTMMTGAGGSNEFVFSAPGTNSITDFGASAGNMLVVRNSAFDLGIDNGTGTSTPQHLDASLFTANATGTFDNTAERFAYATANGKLFYSADGHSSTKELVATLTGHPPVSAGLTGNLFFTS